MTTAKLREQLHKQIENLPDDIVEQIADFTLFVMARRRIIPTYDDWNQNEWQAFAVEQLFRDYNEVDYSLEDAQEIYHALTLDVNRYPGTTTHQRLLRSILSFYEGDSRIRAVCVFGSLGRDAWDEYSDLDLDIIIEEDADFEVSLEARRLTDSFVTIGEHAALIVPDGDDAVDIVLDSLTRLSIRYHPLHNTKRQIIDSLRILSGNLTLSTIRMATVATERTKHNLSLYEIINGIIRYAVEVDVALRRKQRWLAIELLHRMRNYLLEIFSQTRNILRPYHSFEEHASQDLQRRLGATLPSNDLRSIELALEAFTDILSHHLANWSQHQVNLTEQQKSVLLKLRERQHSELSREAQKQT